MKKDITFTEKFGKLSEQQSILMVGFGSIGQGLYPLLRDILGAQPHQIKALCAQPAGNSGEQLQFEKSQRVAREQGIDLHPYTLTADNFQTILRRFLKPGDILINVSVNVSSIDLIRWAQAHQVLYIDTCVEPWEGGYDSQTHPVESTTNAALRREALALNDFATKPQSTAIIAYGANPGLVTPLMKSGLLKIAEHRGCSEVFESFESFEQERFFFASLAQKLGVKAIHIAERDTQTLGRALHPGEAANTWSVDGFLSEAFQRAEAGNGTHEKWAQLSETHGLTVHRAENTQSCVWIDTPSYALRIQSWSPSIGPQEALMIPHHEAASIAQYLTVHANEQVLYRPTVLYAYNPCSALWESLGALCSGSKVSEKTVFSGSEPEQFDELGVLFVTDSGSFWYGSRLTVKKARQLVPFNGPTTLQVTSSIAAALAWGIENPQAGVVEAENLDFRFVLDKCLSYLGDVFFCASDWSPISQFRNSTPLGLDCFLIPTHQ